MNKYDGLYIFVNLGKDENVDALLETVCGEITRLQGKVIASEILGKRTFARPMRKKESGVYVRVRFELAPANVSALRNRYQLMEDVFRVQMQKVDDRREGHLAVQAEMIKQRELARREAEAAATAATAAAVTAEMPKAD